MNSDTLLDYVHQDSNQEALVKVHGLEKYIL